jgi:hypothetical protein
VSNSDTELPAGRKGLIVIKITVVRDE